MAAVQAHVRKGDLVEVTSGKDKGKRGRVLRLLLKKDRVVVERIAMVKRHMKPSQKYPNGGIVEKEGSLAISNVRVVCPKCDATRRLRNLLSGETKSRVCAKCGETIEVAN